MFYSRKNSSYSLTINYSAKIGLIVALFYTMTFLPYHSVYAQCEDAVTEVPIVLVEPGSLTTTFRITNLEGSEAAVTLQIYLSSSSLYFPFSISDSIPANGSAIYDLQDYADDISIPADAEDISLVVSSDSCVTLSVLPNARFTPSTDIGFAPLDVQFNTESLLVNEWDWNFGDGNISIAESPTHTYSEPGTYAVTLTISGDGGTAQLPVPDPIIITVLDEKSRIHLPIIETN